VKSEKRPGTEGSGGAAASAAGAGDSALRSNRLQLLGRIPRRVDLAVRLSNEAVRTDEVSDPARIIVLRAARRTIAHRDLSIGIGEERKLEIVLVPERRVGLRVVEADSDDRGIFLLVGIGEVPEPGTFGGSAGGVGLWIEPEDDVPAPVVAESDISSFLVGCFEIGSAVACLERQRASEQRMTDELEDAGERHAGHSTSGLPAETIEPAIRIKGIKARGSRP
jgi:hypothetical protein